MEGLHCEMSETCHACGVNKTSPPVSRRNQSWLTHYHYRGNSKNIPNATRRKSIIRGILHSVREPRQRPRDATPQSHCSVETDSEHFDVATASASLTHGSETQTQSVMQETSYKTQHSPHILHQHRDKATEGDPFS